ncbi:unnamed protein product [Protopolystoma xenopodis]|uniref:Uncharacterized protein n=1 Tax=Protopolystoma xenopodis TaxID=117903 RepID=A0A448WJA4_9PLAT|nr:unnamed protein product [Protopolystoma xenopodis]
MARLTADTDYDAGKRLGLQQVGGQTLEVMITTIADDFKQGFSNLVTLTTQTSCCTEVRPLDTSKGDCDQSRGHKIMVFISGKKSTYKSLRGLKNIEVKSTYTKSVGKLCK